MQRTKKKPDRQIPLSQLAFHGLRTGFVIELFLCPLKFGSVRRLVNEVSNAMAYRFLKNLSYRTGRESDNWPAPKPIGVLAAEKNL